jgi:hypothetical protein
MIATVTATIAAGVYLVKDEAGTSHRVRSLDPWRRDDRVVVIDGQIVGRSTHAQPSRIYEV